MLELISKLIPTESFARSVVILVSGTAGAQLMLVAAAPLLTRLYSPEDFGLLAIFVSLLAMLRVISSLRYELAITLPKDDEEAVGVVVLCLLLLFLTSLLTVLLIYLIGENFATILGVPKFADYYWLLPFGVLTSGLYSVFSSWGIRTKQFSALAATKLTQAVTTLVIQLITFNLGGIGLLLGHIAGQGTGTTRLAVPTLRTELFQKVSVHEVKSAAFRYKRFPIFSTWSGLVNNLGHSLPPLLFAAYFSAGIAGLYALAHRILLMPTSLLGSALSQVFLAHCSDARSENRLGELYSDLQRKLIEIGLPPTLILIFLGPELFEFVFGTIWREAGVFSQWLALSVFMGFVISPLSQVFIVLERQKEGFILQATLFSSRFLGISIGIWLNDPVLTIALYSLASTFGYFCFLIFGAIYSGSKMINLFLNFIVGSFSSVILALPFITYALTYLNWAIYVSIAITGAFILIKCTLHFLNYK